MTEQLIFFLWGTYRTALYEDVVSNNTLAEQYRQYMLRHLGLTPEQMPTLAESRIAHDQPGCS